MSAAKAIAADWPVLTRYDADHLAQIALPVGGIGTGTVSLGGRGDLRDFEIVNRPAKGFTPENCFFVLRVGDAEGKEIVTRCLEGRVDAALYEGGFGSPARNHGLPRFREAAFEAAYPLGQVLLSDRDVPVQVRLQAFNPLIPCDAERSGIPVAVLRYVLTNPTEAPLTATICGNLKNFIGDDGSTNLAKGNRNAFRTEGDVQGVFLTSEGVPPDAETFGTIALAVVGQSSDTVTLRTAWASRSWGDSLLDFWDDFTGDGRLDEREREGTETPMASLAASVTVPAGETRAVTFLLTWRFPNRPTWFRAPGALIGNWYATQYADAWEVAVKTAAQMRRLEADTVAFVRAFCESDLPEVVKEAALYNVSTLRTQTTFRTADGNLMGWEGCGDKSGCCEGTCTHVWNYEVTTPFLFGDLSRTMREVELQYSTIPQSGHMTFRAALPLADPVAAPGLAAADGQMGCLMKLYRDWTLCGDDDFLRRLWPRARKSLEFCWIPGGWDADKDGVMEGCQHNTMDVEYYGPNPQMGVWYLGALVACREMAGYLGEGEFAAECDRLFQNGSQYLDEILFNGEYYEHHIAPPSGPDAIAPGLRHDSMGARDLSEPELQLGAGCLIDQLVGQYMAHICGLRYLLKPENVKKTLDSLMRYNFQENLWGHFNHLRTFALQEESAMLMATYPKGRRPARPFPYYNEVMTGFEHTAAAHLLYEGKRDEGLRVISAIRARYDGRKRSPFNEAECGHHYARAMAAWASLLALTGFHYDATVRTMTFARPEKEKKAVTHFWSTGSAWGTCRLSPTSDDAIEAELTVLGGALTLITLQIADFGAQPLPAGGNITSQSRASQKVTVRGWRDLS